MRRLFWFVFCAVLLLPTTAVLAERFDVSFPDYKPLHYEGPEYQEQESGWQAGEKLPVIDAGRFTGKCPDLTGCKALSVAVVFRPLDKGSQFGNNKYTSGMLVSSGSGWFDGWRIFMLNWHQRTPYFEIGRPEGAWTLTSSISVNPSSWNAVCVVWDRSTGTVKLYVNGELASKGEFKGELVPPKSGLSIGYSNSGVGSVRQQVRRLIIDDSLWDERTVREISFGNAAALSDFESFLQLKRKDAQQLPQAALLLEKDGLNPVLRGMVAEWLMNRLDNQQVLPADILERVAAKLPDMSAKEQRRLGTALAKSRASEGNLDEAKKIFKQLLSFYSVPDADQAELRWDYADTLLTAGDWSAARGQFKQICDMPTLDIYCRQQAALAVARSYELAKDFDAAIAAFREISALNNIEKHLKWLAEKGIERCNRLSAQKPAFDRNASHLAPPPLPKPAVAFYVSPDGSDDADGSFKKPFATLERARVAINGHRNRSGTLPPGGATVYLRGGNYAVTNTFKLTAADSGSYGAPVVFRAWGGEKPTFSGGVTLKGARRVSDPDALKRLPAAAQGKVRVFDLKPFGIRNFAPPSSSGFCKPNKTVRDFYENGKPFTLARWPNEGFAKTGAVVKDSKTVFHFDRERLAKWAGAADAQLFGYWHYLWADNTLPVAEINPDDGTIKLADTPTYGLKTDMPFYACNLLEELDCPGEWYLDRNAAKVYFWPREGGWFKSPVYTLSNFDRPFLEIDGAREITIEGLVFEYGMGHCIQMQNCINTVLSKCEISKIGGNAINADKCTALQIYGNRISTIGFTGINVSGGNRRNLTSSRINVENNEVCHFSRHTATYNPAVSLNGCGIRVAHNFFHHAPSSAIHIDGNNHLVEFNRVENAVLESDDQGGVDMFGNPSYFGNVFRYNLWRDIGAGRPSCGQGGIRLDDAICGSVIYGNRFYNCSRGIFGGVQIHGGQFNTVDRNLFVNCRYGVSFSPWVKERWTKFLDDNQKKLTEEVNIRAVPYSTQYPELSKLRLSANVNHVWRNLFADVEQITFGATKECKLWDNRQSIDAALEIPLWESLPPAETIGRYPNPHAVP
ncbi:MAG: right-handed parallel beta-helix repeat-containing protein [Kiritimatiellae bacterium]|nr:right-handed parallel beta-helix repeat-containing protein [Kiritimatiellia bacterium]